MALCHNYIEYRETLLGLQVQWWLLHGRFLGFLKTGQILFVINFLAVRIQGEICTATWCIMTKRQLTLFSRYNKASSSKKSNISHLLQNTRYHVLLSVLIIIHRYLYQYSKYGSDSFPEGLIFRMFQGGHAPRPPKYCSVSSAATSLSLESTQLLFRTCPCR